MRRRRRPPPSPFNDHPCRHAAPLAPLDRRHPLVTRTANDDTIGSDPKMAPLMRRLRSDPRFEARLAQRGQHRQMLDQVLDLFEIEPEYDLNIMREDQDLIHITAVMAAVSTMSCRNFSRSAFWCRATPRRRWRGARRVLRARAGRPRRGGPAHRRPCRPFPEEMNRAGDAASPTCTSRRPRARRQPAAPRAWHRSASASPATR